MESAAGTSAARASPPTTTRSQQLWHAAAEAIRALEGDSEPGVCTPVLAHLRRLQGLHERCSDREQALQQSHLGVLTECCLFTDRLCAIRELADSRRHERTQPVAPKEQQLLKTVHVLSEQGLSAVRTAVPR